MIRLLALLPVLLFAQRAEAATSPASQSAAPPALIQCISAAMNTTPDSEGGPLITDCVSVGSNACRNAQSDTSNAATVRCDGQEQAFWEALLTYEFSALQKTLKPAGVASLKASQKAWIPWREARCDFARKSERTASQLPVDVSFCMMETTALRAIDLMYAL